MELKNVFKPGESYKPYLQNGECHYMDENELSTAYMQAFCKAFIKYDKTERAYRLPTEEEKLAESPVPAIEEVVCTEEAPVEEVAPIEDETIVEVPTSDNRVRVVKGGKRPGAVVVTFISTLLLVALAIFASFKAFKSVAYYFAEAGTREIFGFLVNAEVSGMGLNQIILTYALPGTAMLGALLVAITLIISLIALASRKRMNIMGSFMFLALICWLVCGVVAYFAGEVGHDNESILQFINPLYEGGLNWGYYIAVALLLAGTISGFLCYRPKEDDGGVRII